MADSVTQVRLTEAENAYHQLNTGTMARVFVDQNGERVEFTATKKADLYSYIQTLRGQLGGDNNGGLGFNRPLRFFF